MNNFQRNIYRTEVSYLLPTLAYCYDGIWELDDPAHPGGGSVTYKDENGLEDTITNIWNGYPVNFEASSIIAATGVSPC